MNNKFDFIILGGGAAGFAAAIKADELGAKTALINAGLPLGGTCVNVGCVPTKILLEISNDYYYSQYPRFNSLAPVKAKLDFKKVIQEKNKLIIYLRKKKYKNVIASLNNVSYYPGRGEFVSSHQIKVDKEVLEGNKFLIATGSSTKILPIEGLDKINYLTNITALKLKKLPKSMVILGGGPLGLEFAQMFSHFGTKVTVVELMDRLLPLQEEEISYHLQKYLEAEGIIVRTATKTKVIRQRKGIKIVEAETDGKTYELKAEELLLATGVVGNSKDMGLEKIRIKIGKGGFIEVDQHLRTSLPHIYAAGDVAGPPWLETVAAKRGNIATRNALQNTNLTIDYDSIPYAVFTSPQVGSVGLTEKQYRERFKTCNCRVVTLDQVPKALAIKDTRGLIKMVIHHESGKIMGVHILSAEAADLIHEATVAVKFGLTIDDLIDTVHVFPTLSESLKLAAQAFKRDIDKMSCCIE